MSWLIALAKESIRLVVSVLRAVGLVWYRREDCPRILKIMVDAHKLPPTFEGWLKRAEIGERTMVSQGRGPSVQPRKSRLSSRAFFTEVFASLSASPSFVITAFVHAKASSACPRLRMTKSSA
jgi:hypothetical protein